MQLGFGESPSLVVSLALLAGMISQSLAGHLGVPGIVVLLGAGVVLGPDVLGIIDTEVLGPALMAIVNFAVAVILFEGALNLNLRRIRREGRAIRRLLTLGALVTAGCSAVLGRFVLGWNLAVSLVFGALLVVTGPTVINPLLQRIRIKPSVATVLEAEGVFVDAIGAIVAVVVMEVVTKPGTVAESPFYIASRLGVGALFGLVGGAVISAVFRFEKVVPQGHENVTVLAIALTLFQLSSAVMPESGIAAVIAAGLVVGNLRPHLWKEMHEFKGQLTVMLIGLLFVLLAADIRLSSLVSLGWRGALVVALLIFVVRPLAVFLSTAGSGYSVREKAFIAWIGPRGIVAAAVVSVFAIELERNGIEGGRSLRAMVFLTIAVTVLVSGITGGPVARWLGVTRRKDAGWVILGARAIAREIGAALSQGGEDVVFIDADPRMCRAAEERGLRVIYGNGLSPSTLHRAEVEGRRGALGLTQSAETNYVFVNAIRSLKRDLMFWVVGGASDSSVPPAMLASAGAKLFGARSVNFSRWEQRAEEGAVHTERWGLSPSAQHSDARDSGIVRTDEESYRGLVLPIVIHAPTGPLPFAADTQLEPGTEVTFLVDSERCDEARAHLRRLGFKPTSALAA